MEENKTNNKPSNKRVLYLAVVVLLVIAIAVSCGIRGCSGKLADSLSGGLGGASQTVFGNPDHSGNLYSGGAPSNSGVLDTSVASGTPDKRTRILGDGKDVVTVMVYICGSDLESRGGAATMDIMEMLEAGISDNVNLVLYTGGTTKWQNRQMSSDVNQIYSIKGNNLYLLEKNAGNKSMVEPDTLKEFIQYSAKNFPANRNMLILWDHGGGSITGYGADEKFSYTGTMDLSGIDRALSSAGVQFDMIGFDTCLMGTLENALMLCRYSDYLVASEETEVGYGWYYKDWLANLSKNTSKPTIEVGKDICDGFIADATDKGQGYAGTLSVTDLAELSVTVPDKLTAFAENTSDLIDGSSADNSYKTVSRARSRSREFGAAHYIDQVDAVDFAQRMETREGAELADAVLGAIKYNKTTKDMSGAYGLSIYFPYNNKDYVSRVTSVYDSIGMLPSYHSCVKKFAAMEMSGQFISGGTSDPFNSLFGIFGSGDYGNSYYFGNDTGSSYSESAVYDMLEGLFYSQDYSGYGGSGLFRDSLDPGKAAKFISENQFLETNLDWQLSKDKPPVIAMPVEQWELVQSIELNMFIDDGEGYIDLGFDNVFEFDEEGSLLGINDYTWLTVDGNYMAYYYDSASTDGKKYVITGHSPVLYNGERADLIFTFDNKHPEGFISAIRLEGADDQLNIGKRLSEVADKEADLDAGDGGSFRPVIREGDKIEFLADAYDYEGNYLGMISIGDEWTVGKKTPVIANMDLGNVEAIAMYCFTDIYNKKFWTSPVPK